MRVVVTGASGSVGTALLTLLAARGGYEVVGIARRTPPVVEPYRTARWHAVDVASAGAVPVLRDVMTGADAVIHLAWGFQPSHRPDLLRGTAVRGTGAVVGAAHDAGVGHVVHMSSAAVYAPGAAGRAVDETWPATGQPASRYSVDKVEAERIVTESSRLPDAPDVTVVRPGLIGQRIAGAALRRYALPAWVPASALRTVPLVPIDASLAMPAVHADDVAVALERTLHTRVGVLNLAAHEPVGAQDVAKSLRGRAIPVPWPVLRWLAEATWRARLQPAAGGWIDLAYLTPMLDCSRARELLGWSPAHTGPEVWRETVAGMQDGSAGTGPVLGVRSVRTTVRVTTRQGTLGRRRLP
ncbi:NAD-dependent epimerase/dehydratase family protein [Rhodococcus triatomae]|nr:NAD-dependent epimerase/dehydratase [Rhodococcus triatomae BKS 15-14]